MTDARILISDLLSICEQLKERYGTDGYVVFEMRDDNGEFVSGEYCCGFITTAEGNLYLTNNPPRLNEYTS